MYGLVEVFESLQGEGRNMGRPCVFVRFAGCNLDCPWCDTDVRLRYWQSLDELLCEMASYKARSVIITGGEPTVQPEMDVLVDALKARGFWIGVETNGLLSPAWLDRVDYVACSPKADFAARYEADGVLRKADEVRIVATSEAVVGFARTVRARVTATDYYISPCEREGKIDFATAKSVLEQLEGWSLSVQLHKLLGFR